jgi:hypothetical protein
MPSITSWVRLEPGSISADETAGLQARVHDPLWLLGRQWQLGEFQGSDGGSPIVATLHAESALVTRYRAGLSDGNNEGQPFDGSRQPLETLVERESMRQPERLLPAADAGLHFLRLLEALPLSRSYRDLFVQKYPVLPPTPEQRSQTDSGSVRSFEMLAGRVPNGDLLYADLRNGNASLAGMDSADIPLVKAAAAEWLAWYESLFSEPTAGEATWVDERLEYAFSVSARTSAGQETLVAREYIDGQLDWYAFDAVSKVSLGAAADPAPREIRQTTIPAAVTFRGMPAPRWWEFEDAQVDFGGIDAGPEDLARMLLIEFAASYGNDWFVIPLEVETGSLCTVHSLVVTDTFGERHTIPHGSSKGPWRMFQLSSDATASEHPPKMFMPPVVLKNLQGPPIEDVVFFRDEMANMAWAVERVVQGADGRAVNRHDEYTQQIIAAAVPAGGGTLRYELASTVPDHWIPFAPVQIDGSRAIRLRRAAMLDEKGVPQFNRAKGRILTPQPGRRLDLFEEEVPREGVRVTRNYQYTRWLDGTTHVWVGRRKDIGRGEGSSELRFDTLR